MAGKEGGEALAELFAGALKALMELQENAVALVLLVFKIKGKSEAVLQFRAEVRHFLVFHALGPRRKIGHEGVGFVLGRAKGVQKKADALPKLLTRPRIRAEVFEDEGKPDGKPRFGFTQREQQAVAPCRRGRRGGGGRRGGFCILNRRA